MIPDLIALLVTFVLTGWLLGIALIPKRLGATERSLLSLALSVPATILVVAPATLLARLDETSVIGGLIVLAAVAAARAAPVVWPPRIRPPSVDVRGWMIPSRLALLCAGLVIGWLGVFWPQLSSQLPDGLPWRRTTWYYWRLVLDTLQAGRIPATTAEWGAPRPFPVEYGFTTLHTVATALLSGGADVPLISHYRLFVVGLGLIAFWALWRRWMSPWWAWIASVLTMSSVHIAERFITYWPETFGLLLVVWSAWLLDEAFERRSRLWAALAGIVSACAILAHAEVWLLTLPLCLGIAVGRLLWHRGRQGAPSAVPHGGPVSRLRPVILPAAICVLAFALGWAGGSLVTGGAQRIARITTLVQAKPQPKIAALNPDPTWALQSAMHHPETISSPPPDYCGQMFDDVLSRMRYDGVDTTDPRVFVPLGLGALLVAAALWRAGPVPRRAAITWIIFFAGLYGLVFLLCHVYHTYVPNRATVRLKSYDVLAVAGLLAGIGWAFAALVRLVARRASLPAPLRSGAGTLAALVITAPLVLAFTPWGGKPYIPYPPSVSYPAYQAYVWIREHTPRDAIILANGYTQGSIGAIARRDGWLDGRSPYLEAPEWREEATLAVLRAREYFLDPKGHASDLPVPVDYVVVGKPDIVLGGSYFPVNLQELLSSPQLELLRSFGHGEVLVFKVVHRRTSLSQGDRRGPVMLRPVGGAHGRDASACPC